MNSSESSARDGDLPDVAYAAALAGLESMTPQRLQRLLRGRPAEEVFADLRAREGTSRPALDAFGSGVGPPQSADRGNRRHVAKGIGGD